MMDRAVADTSILAAFSAIDRLDLLRETCGEVFVVPAVYREIVTEGAGWIAAASAQAAIISGDGFHLIDPSSLEDGPSPPIPLGAGETEVLQYSALSGIPALLDDSAARRAAELIGIAFVGSLGILKRAKDLGCLDEIRPLISRMVKAGIYYSDTLIDDFLAAVGEKQ